MPGKHLSPSHRGLGKGTSGTLTNKVSSKAKITFVKVTAWKRGLLGERPQSRDGVVGERDWDDSMQRKTVRTDHEVIHSPSCPLQALPCYLPVLKPSVTSFHRITFSIFVAS